MLTNVFKEMNECNLAESYAHQVWSIQEHSMFIQCYEAVFIFI